MLSIFLPAKGNEKGRVQVPALAPSLTPDTGKQLSSSSQVPQLQQPHSSLGCTTQRCSTTNSNPCAGAQPPLLGPWSHQHWAGEISDKNWGPSGPAPAPEGPLRASAQLQRPLGPLEPSTEGEACRPQVTGLPFELCSGKRRLNRVAFLALHDRRLSHFSIFLHGIYRSEAV